MEFLKSLSKQECIYDNSHCCIRTEDSFSSWLQVITGIWQGCIHSPIPFGVAVDWVLKGSINLGINWYERSKLSDLDFVDDIAALSDSIHSLFGLVSAIFEVAGGLGL